MIIFKAEEVIRVLIQHIQIVQIKVNPNRTMPRYFYDCQQPKTERNSLKLN